VKGYGLPSGSLGLGMRTSSGLGLGLGWLGLGLGLRVRVRVKGYRTSKAGVVGRRWEDVRHQERDDT
jgi:hypothetical protein